MSSAGGRSMRSRRGAAAVEEPAFEELNFDDAYDEEEDDGSDSDSEAEGSSKKSKKKAPKRKKYDSDDDDDEEEEEEDEDEDGEDGGDDEEEEEDEGDDASEDEVYTKRPAKKTTVIDSGAEESMAESASDADDARDESESDDESSRKKRSSRSAKKDKKDKKKSKKDKKHSKRDKKRRSKTTTSDDDEFRDSDDDRDAKRKKKKSKKSKSRSSRRSDNDSDHGYDMADEDYEYSHTKSKKSERKSSSKYHTSSDDDDDDYGNSLASSRNATAHHTTTPGVKSTGLGSNGLNPKTGLASKEWVFDNYSALAPYRPYFHLKDQDLTTTMYRAFLADAFFTRDDAKASEMVLNDHSKAKKVRETVKKATQINLLDSKHSSRDSISPSPTSSDALKFELGDDQQQNNNGAFGMNQSTSLNGQRAVPSNYFGESVCQAAEAKDQYAVQAQLTALYSVPTEGPANINPFSLFIPQTIPLLPEYENTVLTETQLKNFRALQVRRSHIHKHYLRSWFPLWCIGQYISYRSSEGPVCARICDVDYNGNAYDLQLPALNVKTLSSSTATKAEMVTHKSTLYLIVTHDGQNFAKVPLVAVSNSELQQDQVVRYLFESTHYAARCNAINAWLCSPEGQKHLKQLENDEEEGEGNIKADQNAQEEQLIPLYCLYLNPYHTPTPGSQPLRAQLPFPRPDQSQYDLLADSYAPIKRKGTTSPDSAATDTTKAQITLTKPITDPGSYYIVTHQNMPAKQITGYITSHSLCYVPTDYDLAYLRSISSFLELETVIPHRRDDIYHVITTFKKVRNWKSSDHSLTHLEELKRQLLQYHQGTFSAEDEDKIKALSASQRHAYAQMKIQTLESEIKQLTEIERQKQLERASKLARATVTQAGHLNAQARHNNKQRWNNVIKTNTNPSIVDIVYHEAPSAVYAALGEIKQAQQEGKEVVPFSAVVRGDFQMASNVLQCYSDNKNYTATVSAEAKEQARAKDEKLTGSGQIKRQRVTLGSVAQRLVQLNDVTQQMASRMGPQLENARQAFKRHYRPDTPQNYKWVYAEEIQKPAD